MTDDLREALVDLSHALDPAHQGACWPDPIDWDGRPLDEQARDLLVLAEDAEGAVLEAADRVRKALEPRLELMEALSSTMALAADLFARGTVQDQDKLKADVGVMATYLSARLTELSMIEDPGAADAMVQMGQIREEAEEALRRREMATLGQAQGFLNLHAETERLADMHEEASARIEGHKAIAFCECMIARAYRAARAAYKGL